MAGGECHPLTGVGEAPALSILYPHNYPQARPLCGHCVPSLQTHHHLGWALKTGILEGREATSLNHSALQIVKAA